MADLLTVSSRGQITIPAVLREKYDIQTGDRIFWEEATDGLLIKKARDFFQMEGCFSLGKIADDEEELLTPAAGKRIQERE